MLVISPLSIILSIISKVLYRVSSENLKKCDSIQNRKEIIEKKLNRVKQIEMTFLFKKLSKFIEVTLNL